MSSVRHWWERKKKMINISRQSRILLSSRSLSFSTIKLMHSNTIKYKLTFMSDSINDFSSSLVSFLYCQAKVNIMIKYQEIIMIRIKDKLKCVYFINYVSTFDIIELLMHYSIRDFFTSEIL
jgi:hypothetical protein